MTTWRDTATGRGFADQGDGTWLAPNGVPVAEGFVEAVTRDIERVLASVTESSLDLRDTARQSGPKEAATLQRNVDYRHTGHRE